MTGSVATDQLTLVDRLLAQLQNRFPREFEICLLAAQNEELQEKVAGYEAEQDDGQQAIQFENVDG